MGTILKMMLLLLIVVSIVNGHICPYNPVQRGNDLNISVPGDPSCYIRTDICSSQPPSPPVVSYYPGDTVLLHFQQNLNHYYTPKPGLLDVSISYNSDLSNGGVRSFQTLDSFPDWPAHEMVRQTNLTFAIQLPATKTGTAVLRYRYVSNNPGEIDPKSNIDAIFYNCVDIDVTNSAPIRAAKRVERPPSVVSEDNFNCTTPPRFMLFVTELNTLEGVEIDHKIYWDASATGPRVKWVRTKSDGTFISTYNDYSTGNEWVYFSDANRCELYGPDKFYPWTFGVVGSVFTRTTPNGDKVFVNFQNEFVWEAKETAPGVCMPLSWGYAIDPETPVLFNRTSSHECNPGDSDIECYGPNWFSPPSVCPPPRKHQGIASQ